MPVDPTSTFVRLMALFPSPAEIDKPFPGMELLRGLRHRYHLRSEKFIDSGLTLFPVMTMLPSGVSNTKLKIHGQIIEQVRIVYRRVRCFL